MAKRDSNLTSPKTMVIDFIPDAERVDEAARIAAPAARRLTVKNLKLQEELPVLVKIRERPKPPPAA